MLGVVSIVILQGAERVWVGMLVSVEERVELQLWEGVSSLERVEEKVWVGW